MITYILSFGSILVLTSINLPSLTPPPIIVQAEQRAEFFAANIRTPNMRRVNARAARDFMTWCFDHGVRNLADIAPIYVAAWIDWQP
ncbi:hypothetical protein [Sphingobium yanoikuyae]|uniref:hypothetical protein n=1 Tax=Sphingobium yanoikuyae TaxID=13690 RepID=UPI0028AF0D6C|nr:hypothetical protein [Sphingobium yanoikuyae]